MVVGPFGVLIRPRSRFVHECFFYSATQSTRDLGCTRSESVDADKESMIRRLDQALSEELYTGVRRGIG